MVFDETIFPFAALHPNAGARLRSEVLLLPEHLQNPSIGDLNYDPILTSSPTSNVVHDDAGQTSTVQGQDTTNFGANPPPHDRYFMLQDVFPGADP